MAIVNLKKRQIECKIVYYGPGRCGKTTNLEHIHKAFKNQVKGEMVSINTDGDRTLFFDFLPLELGKLKGCDVRVQLYTVPGQVRYESTRKLVLRGADGIVFVADSLEEYNLSIFKVPLVMQFNKRDLSDDNISLMSIEQMQHDLNRQLKVPCFPGSALTGKGVGKTLNACLKLLLKSIQKELNLGG